jgi:hypothetical protein
MARKHAACFYLPWTGRRSSRRWLYALGIDDGRIKIGITHSPRDRMHVHGRAMGQSLLWFHIGPSAIDGVESRAAEYRALQAAGLVGERIGNTEMFRGLTREQALECLRYAVRAV